MIIRMTDQRTCKKCGETKAAAEFEVYNKLRGWRRWECRACIKRRVQAWAAQSKTVIHKVASNPAYLRNRENAIAAATRWNREHPERRRKTALAHYYRMQHQAMLAYGGYVCACCGETEPLFLTLDHINGDGAEIRRNIGTLGGTKLYKWLRDNGWPPGYQVLCLNCNQGRYRNGGVCPHQQKGVTTIPKGSSAKRRKAHGSPTQAEMKI